AGVDDDLAGLEVAEVDRGDGGRLEAGLVAVNGVRRTINAVVDKLLPAEAVPGVHQALGAGDGLLADEVEALEDLLAQVARPGAGVVLLEAEADRGKMAGRGAG